MADLNDTTSDFPYTQYPEVEPLTAIVCDIGDVLLVADDGSHPPLRIQASSVLLSTASKVFRALFRGSFAEGEALCNAAELPAEIRISDAPDDILLLCQLLHFRGDLENVRHQRFLDLALIIDEYDCAQALLHVIISKFATLDLCGDDQVEHVCYLAAAWILDQPKFFRGLSKEIVTHYEHGPLELDDSRLDVLPDKVLTSIHAQRAFAGQELVYHLSKFITKYHTAAFALNATAYSNELTQTMLDCDLWPLDLKEYYMDYLFGELREYHVPIMQADNLEPQPQSQPQPQPNDVHVNAFHFIDPHYVRRFARGASQEPLTEVVKPPTKFELVLIVERIERICVGLCLDCLKGNDRCRVQHSDPFSNDLWDGSNDGPGHRKGTKRPVEWESIW